MTPNLLVTQRPHTLVQAMTLTLSHLMVCVDAAAHAPDQALAPAFSGLVAAVESAFRQEEDLMEDTAYPGLHAQRQDNALILCALHHAHARVENGDMAIAREVIAALPGFLSLHRLTALDMINYGPDGAGGYAVRRNGPIRVQAAPRQAAGKGL